MIAVVKESSGSITSVDLKNMIITIEESKNNAYNFSDRTFVYDRNTQKHIKVKDLKKGGKVSFRHIIIGGRRIILSLDVLK